MHLTKHLAAAALLLATTLSAQTSSTAPLSAAPPAGVTEREVTLGSGEWAVRGAVTLPAEGGPFPAIVLVGGSGPGSLDLDVGPNKIFRDLAWGLARQGVAVMRFEKRSHAHAARFRALGRRATLEEEFIDDATAAARLLRETPGVDARRVYVLGHSQGGGLAPGIVRRLGLAGVVVVNSSPRTPSQIILDQAIYFESLARDGAYDAQQARMVREGAELIATATERDSAVILGNPAWYWASMARVDTPADIVAVRARGGRVLMVHGGRDYLVTQTDWDAWPPALAGASGIDFRQYPDLNHLLQPGVGRMTPAEYNELRPVSPELIRDLAAWIRAGAEG
jgi:dienelactone hydrolase